MLGPRVAPEQRLARFRQLFHNDFDVPGIGRFVLGRYWRTASPQEQQEFLSYGRSEAPLSDQSDPLGYQPYEVYEVYVVPVDEIVVIPLEQPSEVPISGDELG